MVFLTVTLQWCAWTAVRYYSRTVYKTRRGCPSQIRRTLGNSFPHTDWTLRDHVDVRGYSGCSRQVNVVNFLSPSAPKHRASAYLWNREFCTQFGLYGIFSSPVSSNMTGFSWYLGFRYWRFADSITLLRGAFW